MVGLEKCGMFVVYSLNRLAGLQNVKLVGLEMFGMFVESLPHTRKQDLNPFLKPIPTPHPTHEPKTSFSPRLAT